MKNLLIATTALVATAGMAAADGHAGVSVSGNANAGIFSDATGEGVYNQVNIIFGGSVETENGLTFGADAEITSAGQKFNREDFERDGSGNGQGGGSVYVSGDFGKLTFKGDDIEDYYEGDAKHDLGYEGTFNGITVGLTYDVDGDNSFAGTSDASIKLGYATGAITASVVASNETAGVASKIDVAYVVSESVTLGLNHKMPSVGDAVTEARATFGFSGATVNVKADTADDWEVSVGYTMAATGVTLTTNQADEWKAEVTYDLGGGATAEAGINHADVAYAGITMSF